MDGWYLKIINTFKEPRKLKEFLKKPDRFNAHLSFARLTGGRFLFGDARLNMTIEVEEKENNKLSLVNYIKNNKKNGKRMDLLRVVFDDKSELDYDLYNDKEIEMARKILKIESGYDRIYHLTILLGVIDINIDDENIIITDEMYNNFMKQDV